LVADVLVDISVAAAFDLKNSVVIQCDVSISTINAATTVEAFCLNATGAGQPIPEPGTWLLLCTVLGIGRLTCDLSDRVSGSSRVKTYGSRVHAIFQSLVDRCLSQWSGMLW
jgi:hypothetical protein